MYVVYWRYIIYYTHFICSHEPNVAVLNHHLQTVQIWPLGIAVFVKQWTQIPTVLCNPLELSIEKHYEKFLVKQALITQCHNYACFVC